MRFHDGVCAADHTGDAWTIEPTSALCVGVFRADGWRPRFETGVIEPFQHSAGELYYAGRYFEAKEWKRATVPPTRANPDGTVTTIGVFSSKETAEAYLAEHGDRMSLNDEARSPTHARAVIAKAEGESR